MVDARDDQLGLEPLDQPERGEAHAVHRRSVGGVADGAVAEVDLLHPQRPARRDPAADRGAVGVRRDDGQLEAGDAEQRPAQRLQALSLDPVVVCEEDPHGPPGYSAGGRARRSAPCAWMRGRVRRADHRRLLPLHAQAPRVPRRAERLHRPRDRLSGKPDARVRPRCSHRRLRYARLREWAAVPLRDGPERERALRPGRLLGTPLRCLARARAAAICGYKVHAAVCTITGLPRRLDGRDGECS